MYLSSSGGRALDLEIIVSWVRVPPEAADFSLEKSSQVLLNCVVLLCISEGVSKFVYHYIKSLHVRWGHWKTKLQKVHSFCNMNISSLYVLRFLGICAFCRMRYAI